MFCCFNNKIVPISDALVPVTDLAVLRGYGVFDLAYAKENKIFYGTEHLKRFQNSAKILSLCFPYQIPEIEKISRSLLEKNNYAESTVRWVLTGGMENNGIGEKPNLFIINEELKPFPVECYENGITIQTIDAKREIPQAKTLNYQIYYSRLKYFKKNNIFELLFAPKEVVLECATANIFVVKHNIVKTPRKDILPGITRSVVIDLCRKNNINISETKITLTELLDADEIFVTSTTKKIMPVTKIDNKYIGNGEVGKIVQNISALFRSFEKDYFSK